MSSTLLIANNCTRESGSFLGDQCCMIKAAYLFVENQPDVDKVIMSVSPGNEMDFLWTRFVRKFNVELVYDDWNPGDWTSRWMAWDKWRKEREIEGRKFDHYRELYLRIHGMQRQTAICGSERGLGKNIFEYWFYGQEQGPESCIGADWFDDTLIDHPDHTPTRDVYISPHCKTQGNVVFTFDYWTQVVHKLIDAGISVTVGYNGYFCGDLLGHPLYKLHWGDHKQWMEQLSCHKIVSCGNTGTGWLAAACGVPLFTMEPPNSQMPDHRYRRCGLRNLIEVLDTPDPDYCAKRLIEEVRGVKDPLNRPRIQVQEAGVEEICRLAQPHSVNPFEKIKIAADFFLRVVDLPGDVADLGAYRGGISFMLRRLGPNKKLHLFDTWSGTPFNDELCHHKKGDWPSVLEDCMKVVGTNITNYYKGVFPYTAKSVKNLKFCFVYVDPDVYQTVCAAIDFFWPRMTPGGIMLFDDYGWEPCAGVKKAVDGAFTDEQKTVIPSNYTCVVTKK